MSLESRIVRGIIGWLWKRYKFQVLDIVCGKDRHIHFNPNKRPKEAA